MNENWIIIIIIIIIIINFMGNCVYVIDFLFNRLLFY